LVGVRASGGDDATAIRVDSGAGVVPAAAAPLAPQTPPALEVGAVSLQELAQGLRARATTSTTKVRPATTTTKAVAAKRPPATTTTVAPARTTTTAAGFAPPRAAPASTTTTKAVGPLPSVVQAVVPPVTAVASAVTRTDSGIASWFNAPDATCAHRTLPMGTMVKVTRIHNGAVASCKVNDRGPTLETGRLIDLSLDTFEKLAASEAGLIDVRIEW
jgi:rare lipoprotein A